MESRERAERAVVGGSRPHDVEPLAQRPDQVETLREPADGAVDGADGELVLGQFDDEGHHEVVRPGPAAVGGAALGLIGAGRLVAMVAVGQDDGRRRHGGADRRHGVGVAQDPELVADPVVVVGVGHRLVVGGVEGGRHPGRHGEAPDRRQVGPRGPQQVQAVALRLGQRLLVGEDVALLARLGEPERPDDAGGGAPRRVGHPVGVQARLRLHHDGALRLPAGEQVGRHGVAVATCPQVGLGQLDQDGIGRVAGGQVHALGRRDDVVGRGDDLGDGRHLGPVPQPLERFETRHRATLAHRQTWPSGATP